MDEELKVLTGLSGNGPSITIISIGVPTGAPARTFADDDETDNNTNASTIKTVPTSRKISGNWW